jgi:O-acetyl-ADP-ribose deacetylase (regulator of RNase III)
MKVLKEYKAGSKTLRLVQGDLTTREVDAIENAANTHLPHGGGVAGALVRAGGDIIQQESDKIGYIDVGTATITTAGSLPSRYVIHTVGPQMGEGNEDEKLASAVLSSLGLAAAEGLKSISMPAVSSGIYGFPKDRCAATLVRESYGYLMEYPQSSLQMVEFCVLDDITAKHFIKEFDILP